MRGTVEIVGGGIGGLFIGYLLAREGWHVRVNERHSQIREIGAALFLKNNAVTVLEHVGIAELVLKRAVCIRRAEIRDHKDRLLQRRALVGPARAFNLPRSDLVLGLAQAARIAGADIVTDAPVAQVDPGGSLILANGDIRTADLIIDASGSNSPFRHQLGLTSACRELATGATRHLVPRTDFEAEDMTREWWGGRRRIGIAPATADLTHIYMSCPQSDLGGIRLPVDIESWKRSFPMLYPALARLRGAGGGTRHAFTYVRCRKWSKGCVALIGDAAHCMPPTLGQGAGCTLMSAYVLSKELSRSSDLGSALASWESAIRPVTDETQSWALRYDALTANWPLWLSGVRRGVIWTFGRWGALNARMRVADRTDVTKAA
ncbi:MAG TPA: NAD(P)/FAD-dependent oxidoreductase [Xanthobacteraceae bacterium]|jgi:2-polyprenyl-6-methoxyphenol hydroxylase-like FAD-dependent oxidoreductase